MYIDGYPQERSYLIPLKYSAFFKRHFAPKEFDNKDSSIYALLESIKTSNSCGIHARRGDLADFDPAYGYPASKEYFLKAINAINTLHKNVVFYFFSDEPKWVVENIIPYLRGVSYKICAENGSDKGYLDLYLLSWCKYIISSNGSLGVFGKFLSQRENTQLYMCKFRATCESLSEIYVINDPKCYVPRNPFNLVKAQKVDLVQQCKRKYRIYRALFVVTLMALVASFVIVI